MSLLSLLLLLLGALGLLRGDDARGPGAPVLPTVVDGGARASRGLVVGLHGGSWSRREREELARRLLGELSTPARKVGLRVLVPLLPEDAPAWREGDGAHTVPWLSPAGEAAVLALVAAEVAAGRADPGRVYLAGHGAGATAALLLAARHPEQVAAVACWSGTPPPLWDEQRRVVGLVEDPVPRLRGVPVYLWTGEDDPVLDRAVLELFVRGMRAQSELDAAWVLQWDEGRGGHGFGTGGARAGLRFLKGHRKQARP